MSLKGNARMTIRPGRALYTCQRQNFPFNNISFHPTKGASHLLEKGPHTIVQFIVFYFSLLKSCNMVMGQDECWLRTWEAKNMIEFDVKYNHVFQNTFFFRFLSTNYSQLFVSFLWITACNMLIAIYLQLFPISVMTLQEKKDRCLKAVEALAQSESVCHPSIPETPSSHNSVPQLTQECIVWGSL